MSDSDTKSQGQAKKEPVAVALAYEPESEFAPKVVAGGRGSIAEKILEIAFAHDIKVREDADLAQLLSAIDIDDEIPVEAFAAVSEILAYVYRASGAMPPLADEPPADPAP
ncbi:MAG: EscU/YscU/HrcU family type III secretion system export apparatus switch protein [Rhodospirillales bacterium]